MSKLSQFAVFSLTILIGTLISDYTVNYFTGLIGKTYNGVLLNMLVTVLIFYPLLNILDLYIKKVSRKYINNSKKAVGNSSIGLILGFTLAILVLFIMFAKVWYNLDALSYLKSFI